LDFPPRATNQYPASARSPIFSKPLNPLNLPDYILNVTAGAGELGRFFGQVGLINRSREKDLKAPACDVSALENDLGVRCEKALEVEFAKTLEWYRANKQL
jgi:nucleoside-diphosphate-sugar epimerase